MRKFKVYMPCGTIQTIIAKDYNITWSGNDCGILRFVGADGNFFAVFPTGGWHGVQDMDAYKVKEVV